ncbi:hypothetical protein Glove_502g9 [Diversispora epigaea]|uniref:Uncharacterized protein n=1 Tax=Diversispora epigaea TaxID=1348612 RepID=A0A397GGZ1_9GLOM|nr:hypothetical protein Glove_502g9 [Diversispora epigaea]
MLQRIFRYPYFIYNAHIQLKYTFINAARSTLPPMCPQCPHRFFHSTNYNSLGMDNNMRIDPDDPIIKKIRTDPSILTSITEFATLLKNKGVDLSNGQMPSFMQMAKLAGDKEVSEKLDILNKQFHQAGIAFDAETAQKFMSIQNKHATENQKTNVPYVIDSSSPSSDDSELNSSKIINERPTIGLMNQFKAWFGRGK